MYLNPLSRNGLAGLLLLAGTSLSPALLAQDAKNAVERPVASENLETTGAPVAGEAGERAVGESGTSSPVPDRQFGMDRPSPPHFSLESKGRRRLALSAPTLFTGDVKAPEFFVPMNDGSSSLWSTTWFPNSDGSQNDISSWGFNMFAAGFKVDPARAGMILEFENNYLWPGGDKQVEAYIQFQNIDNFMVRPFQIEIPIAGPRMNHAVMYTMGDSFSFTSWDGQKGRVKVYDYVALARNVPLVFTTTNDCPGCGIDVGLKPYLPHELAVFYGLGLGNLRAGAVTAATFWGDGSAVTNLNASNIRLGTLQDTSLSSNVALIGRSNAFRTTQFFDTTGLSGQPGVAIRGSATNPNPNLSLSSIGLPVGHDWRVTSRGDNGALLVSNETDPAGSGKLAIDTQGIVWVAKDLVVQGKVRVQEGPNASIGQIALQGGSATVPSASARSASRIFLTHAGAVGTLGELYVGTVVDGVSFEIRSTSASDASPVNYWIVN